MLTSTPQGTTYLSSMTAQFEVRSWTVPDVNTTAASVPRSGSPFWPLQGGSPRDGRLDDEQSGLPRAPRLGVGSRTSDSFVNCVCSCSFKSLSDLRRIVRSACRPGRRMQECKVKCFMSSHQIHASVVPLHLKSETDKGFSEFEASGGDRTISWLHSQHRMCSLYGSATSIAGP